MLRTGQVAEEQHIVDYLWREECHFEREQGRSRSCDTVYMQTGEYSPNITNSVPFTPAIHVQLNHVLKIKNRHGKLKNRFLHRIDFK